MASNSEKKVEALFTRLVKKAGGLTWKLAPTETGIPDRIALLPNGTVWFVELKRAKGGRVSPRQALIHRHLEKRRGNAAVLAGEDDVLLWATKNL